MAFNISTSKDGQKTLVSLKGSVDEDAIFQPLDTAGSTGVILDLKEVTAINSVGIREWIKWMKMLPEGTSVGVRNCPKIIVDQINMVAGFLPLGAVVESFFVPYYADESGEEKMVLYTSGKEFRGGDVFPPTDVKDSEGKEMEMDIIEAKYFKFLKNA
jgi:hypothetical protein